MSTVSEEKPSIWYSHAYSLESWGGGLWMEPKDPQAVLTWLARYEDAINITNAYEVFRAPLIDQLRRQAGYL